MFIVYTAAGLHQNTIKFNVLKHLCASVLTGASCVLSHKLFLVSGLKSIKWTKWNSTQHFDDVGVWDWDWEEFNAINMSCDVVLQLVPPLGMLNNPMNAVTTKFVRTSTNKVKCPVFVIRVRTVCLCVSSICLCDGLVDVLLGVSVQWTPEGRRLVTGASSGEFTLWNGLTFNFETILQVNTQIHLNFNYCSWTFHCFFFA